jgi:hypothetical protein
MMDHPALRLGETLDAEGRRSGTPVAIEPGHLTTHGVIVGMTGSGKTGLGIVLLEEALSRGIPALILDPKGDMGNLLLNFPGLRPEDFRPWIDTAEAARTNQSPDELAASTATRWQKGLADWGVTPDMMRKLGTNARFTIFTPGATSGVPINVVGSLQAPAPDASAEDVADEIEGFTSGLLALTGRGGDPLSSADHILISNLIARAWHARQDLDLATLVMQVANPPIRKLGVFELDTFMPPKDRMALAVQLNSLLASPSFAPWMRGVPLDMQRLLYDERGRPRAAIIYLAHLSEPERQFIVTLVMSRMVSWMRRQPGTSDLRALVYMDEVAGFAPPSAQPPSKKPILTILKQARAHGVGMVLSTQNPMDLDYMAMSNAGTWMIGRLQTERDKARILEGLRSASGDTDINTLGTMISGLAQRQFLLHTARGDAPRRFTTRWAMSFLRGPLTRVEIDQLTSDDPDRQPVLSAAATGEPPSTRAPAPSHAPSDASSHTLPGASPNTLPGSSSHSPPDASLRASPDASMVPASMHPPSAASAASAVSAAQADDTVALAPAVAAGVRVRYLDAAAPWAAEVGARPGGTRLQASVAARVNLKYADRNAGIDHTEVYECVFFPLADPARPEEAHVVDYDERDLRVEAPASAMYLLSDVPINATAFFRTLERQLKDHLYRTQTTEVFVNTELKLYARVGESRDEFASRCSSVASDRADEEAARLRTRIQSRLDRLQKNLQAADDRVRELTVDSRQRVQQEIIAGAGQLLSVFMGGRAGVRSLGGAASRRSVTRRTQERLDTAKGRALTVGEEMRQIEQELGDDLAALQEKWEAVAGRIETKAIQLTQSNVVVDEVVLLWIPVA